MDVIKAYNDARHLNQLDQRFSEYKRIVAELEQRGVANISENEMEILAFCYADLYLNKDENPSYASRAKELFQQLIDSGNTNADVYEDYAFVLEESLDYETSYNFLTGIIHQDISKKVKKMAYNFLSNYGYCADGFCTYKETVDYKKRALELADDPEEKKRLQAELERMIRASEEYAERSKRKSEPVEKGMVDCFDNTVHDSA